MGPNANGEPLSERDLVLQEFIARKRQAALNRARAEGVEFGNAAAAPSTFIAAPAPAVVPAPVVVPAAAPEAVSIAVAVPVPQAMGLSTLATAAESRPPAPRAPSVYEVLLYEIIYLSLFFLLPLFVCLKNYHCLIVALLFK